MKRSFYLVAGLGKTGLSIARYLHRKNKPFVLFDTRLNASGLDEFKAEFPHIPVYLESLPEELIGQLIDVIASPGVSLDTPCLQQALQAGVPIYGDIECLAREIKAPVIAITGTNGKSTVTTLVGEMAKMAGLNVAVAGNIGTPVLDLLDEKKPFDLWVLELSSFQLDLTFSLKPQAATILNFSPDHLDRHHTVEAYWRAKQRIYDKAVIALSNRDESDTYPAPRVNLAPSSQTGITFGQGAPEDGQWGLIEQEGSVFLAQGKACLMPVDALLMKGVHNWLNALAAAALAQAAGIELQIIINVLKTFTGLPHRCQWVRSLDGVEWINDSKGTNVGATVSAINGIGGAMQGKIVLIAGGQGKGADFDVLSAPIAEFVRSIVLIGEDADKIEATISNAVPTVRANTIENAVMKAQLQAKPGDVVLLSPACASLDMFRDFNHRGEVFASCVNGLSCL